jgi:hypothetical protein
MIRKLFIVARTHPTVYNQLRRTVGREAGVDVIYDRRPTVQEPGKLHRFIACLQRLLPGAVSQEILETLDRRQRRQINEDLKNRGWAVARIESPASDASASAASQPKYRAVVEPEVRRVPPPAAPGFESRPTACRPSGER